MTTFSGQLNIKPTLAYSLGTNEAFDLSLKNTHDRLEQKVSRKQPLTVTLGEIQDFKPDDLVTVGIDPATTPPTALVAILNGYRELKGLVPSLRRWFTGFSKPTKVHELLVMDDGQDGIGQFLKQVQKTLGKQTFWSAFVSPKTVAKTVSLQPAPPQAILRTLPNSQEVLPKLQLRA